VGFFVAATCVAETKLAKRLPHRSIALTFDDLPAPSDSIASDNAATMKAMTQKLLAIIKRSRIPAIGFVNEGRLYEGGEFPARVDILQMWTKAGLELGNHTFSHWNLQTTPLEEYQNDVIRGEFITKLLLRQKRKKLQYFRYPFLEVGSDLATRDKFEQFLSTRKYKSAPVTISNDEYMFAAVYAEAQARGDEECATQVAQAYLSYMEQMFAYFERFSVDVVGYEVKQILLLHADALNADHLTELVQMMSARGYRFVSLRRALKDRAYRREDTDSNGGISWITRWAHSAGQEEPEEPEIPEFVRKQYRSTAK
jgi:peptidoglycan-N-acetylglucosamine deacetylase